MILQTMLSDQLFSFKSVKEVMAKATKKSLVIN